MTTVAQETIGERIELLRRRRGLSRQTLASLVGHSSEWLRQVERKGRGVDRLSTLLRLAEVLQVKDVAAFMGVAVPGRRVDEPTFGAAPDIRAALLGHRAAVRAGGHRPGDIDRLASEVTEAWTWWRQSARRWSAVRTSLPGLLERVCGPHIDRAAPEALRLSAETHRLAAAYLHSSGDLSLALLATDRALAEARLASAPLTEAACLQGFGDVLLRLQAPAEACEMCVTAADALELYDGSPACETTAARVRLYLTAAEAAAFARDHHGAERLLDRAAMLVQDAQDMTSVPSPVPPGTTAPARPVDVAIYRVRVEVVLGRSGKALRLAEHVGSVDTLDREGRARFYLTLARAHLHQRNQPGAVLALMQADRASPEEVRFNVYAQHLLKQAIGQDSVTVRHDLYRLAERAGLL
ncbi:transcriptional regulator with XRE-family HTH domain [Streptomyces sp. 840.1]|uniref:helix-turn-helix domain-containing protein n=1 Tax=Streptomyces sp. 840.1 TaxID=2485152 RepID=UPI000F46EE84|nr:helix-turn-helix domain-containing protein [Streptomyces sp. 840.1]ROQ68289.1 transcriptional regulator with XRE-family HTH domain [Streptomyces sp. 840.1]